MNRSQDCHHATGSELPAGEERLVEFRVTRPVLLEETLELSLERPLCMLLGTGLGSSTWLELLYDAANPVKHAPWLPSRLIPHRHRPRAELQPAHELQVDMLR